MECSSLTSITLPDTVTTIAPGAFSNCIQLESFVFPENPQFTKISKETFKGCTKLEEVLVGSEMCIRDRFQALLPKLPRVLFKDVLI